jgi:hypothetical protein
MSFDTLAYAFMGGIVLFFVWVYRNATAPKKAVGANQKHQTKG